MMQPSNGYKRWPFFLNLAVRILFDAALVRVRKGLSFYPPEIMNTEKSVVWLVTYGFQFCPDTPYEKIHTFSTLMEGPKSIKLAETVALQRHVPEAFRKKPQGQWIT